MTKRVRQCIGAKSVAFWALAISLCAPRFVEASPRIIAVDPSPEVWLVDGSTLGEVTLTFDTPVVVDAASITAMSLAIGPIPVFNVQPTQTPTEIIIVSLPGMSADRVTLIVDFTVVDEQGAALDGEVVDPQNPMFPTGNGAPGGAAVFQFTILQGDVNRDGKVDITDFGAFQAALAAYNPAADFNDDGVIDELDEDILLDGFGAALPKMDAEAPLVASVSPSSFAFPAPNVIVTFSEGMNPLTVTAHSVYAIGANGILVTGSAPPMTVDNIRFVFPFADLLCQQHYMIQVSNQVADLHGRLLETGAAHLLEGTDTDAPEISCPLVGFINSTDPFSIPISDFSSHPDLQDFIADIEMSDACTPTESLVLQTSLELLAEPLGLGVNLIEFTAVDAMGNSASCESVLIVVPAVPLDGSVGATGPPGQSGADGTDGADGSDGNDGVACWDSNQNQVADPEEDLNNDGIVDVVDCQGIPGRFGQQGPEGPAGPQGPEGPSGTDGSVGTGGTDGIDGSDGSDGSDGTGGSSSSDGQTPTDDPGTQPVPDDTSDPTATPRCGEFCGAMGMINLLFMFVGLGAMRECYRGGARRARG